MNIGLIVKKDRKIRGFTIFELLVVVSIIAIMFVVSVPAFQGIGRGQKMNSAVAQLRSTIALARQWAVTRNDYTYIIFPDADYTYNQGADAFMALKSYAVWSEKNGYISDWRYLPEGIVFNPDANSLNSNLFNGETDRVFPVEFPVSGPGASTQDMYAISFAPNGRLNQNGGTTLSLLISEGWMSVNTNSGVADGPEIIPQSTRSVTMEIRPLTGGVKVTES